MTRRKITQPSRWDNKYLFVDSELINTTVAKEWLRSGRREENFHERPASYYSHRRLEDTATYTTVYVTFEESRKYFFRAVYLFEHDVYRSVQIESTVVVIFQERSYICRGPSHSLFYCMCILVVLRQLRFHEGNSKQPWEPVRYDASSLSVAIDREKFPILRFFVPHIDSCRIKKMTGVGVKDTHRWCRSCVGWSTKPGNIGLVLLKWSVLFHTANFNWGDWRSVD